MLSIQSLSDSSDTETESIVWDNQHQTVRLSDDAIEYQLLAQNGLGPTKQNADPELSMHEALSMLQSLDFCVGHSYVEKSNLLCPLNPLISGRRYFESGCLPRRESPRTGRHH